MKLIALDTSTSYCVVVLCDKKGIVCGQRRLFEKGRSEGLFLLLEQCLKKAKWELSEVDGFGVGIGPGSFTGLRIGVSAAKGFCFGLNKPCYAFSSLDAIAYNKTPCQRRTLAVVVDARRQNVYLRYYRRDGRTGILTREGREALVPVEVWVKENHRDICFCGDALGLYQEALAENNQDAQFLSSDFWYPTPESLASLAREAAAAGAKSDCFSLRPLYLYSDDCQVDKSKVAVIQKHE